MNTFGDNRNLGRTNMSSYKPSAPNKVNTNAYTIHSAPTSLDHVKEMQQDLEMHRKNRTEIGIQLSENTAQISAVQSEIMQIRSRIEQISSSKASMPIEIAKQAGNTMKSVVTNISENDLVNGQNTGSFEADGEIAELRKSLREKEAQLNDLMNDVRKVLNKKYDMENRIIHKLNSMINEARSSEQKARRITETTKTATETATKTSQNSLKQEYIGKTTTQRAKEMRMASQANKKQAADQLAKFSKAKNPTRAAKAAADAQKAARSAADLANASAKVKVAADGAAVAGKTAAAAASTAGEAGAAAGGAGAGAAGAGAGAASGPVGWIVLAVILILKYIKPPKLVKAKAGKDSSENVANEAEAGAKNTGKIAGYAARMGSLVWPFLMPFLFLFGVIIAFFGIIVILMFLFQLASTEPDYTIRDAVIITEQEYHSQLIQRADEYFQIDAEHIYYSNNTISWKNMLCLWYCLGTTHDEFILKDVDPSDVYDIVKNVEMRHEDYELMTEAFNMLNTIIVYPSTMNSNIEVLSTETRSEEEINRALEGLVEGIDYTYEDGFYYINETISVCNVDVDSVRALEYAEKHGYDEEFIAHINNCMDSISNDDPDLEPVFYELWQAICELTSVDANVRDELIQTAYAMWIMSGCNHSDSVPDEALNQFTQLDVTIYREPEDSDDHDIPFNFFYRAIDNDNVSSVSTYGLSSQSEYDVPIFLNNEYGRGVTCTGGSMNVTGLINRNEPPDLGLLCEGFNWSAYSYHCATYDGEHDYAPNYREAWCAAFITALGQNMRYHGCYFVDKDFIIDTNHPSWTLVDTNSDFEEAEGRFMESLGELLDTDLSADNAITTLAGNIADAYNTLIDMIAEYADETFLNEINISAHTNYYRANLSNHYSETRFGLLDETKWGDVYTPSDSDSSNYKPPRRDDDDRDVWIDAYYTLSPDDSRSSTGHSRGWYAPRMHYYSELGDTDDPIEFYYQIAICRLAMNLIIQHSGDLAQLAADVLAEAIEAYISESENPMITWMNSQMSSDCAIFSEVMEEQQNLFPFGIINCHTGFYDFFTTSTTVDCYSHDAIGELYTPQVGDIVLFDWIKRETGTRDGIADHVGLIVWVSDDGSRFATIEGNSSRSVRMNCFVSNSEDVYAIGHVKYGGVMD